MVKPLTAWLLLTLAATPAEAVPTAVGRTGATFDAAAETLEAGGAAAADLRAPSAAVARVKAERSARTQAEKKLIAALVELGLKRPLEELGELADSATVRDLRYGSDGSVELTLSLSTSALKLRHPHKR